MTTTPNTTTPGTDTATGTDPDARFDRSGYEDKSFGQAVAQDAELAEELDGRDDAEEAFEAASTGAPARQRQHHPETG